LVFLIHTELRCTVNYTANSQKRLNLLFVQEQVNVSTFNGSSSGYSCVNVDRGKYTSFNFSVLSTRFEI